MHELLALEDGMKTQDTKHGRNVVIALAVLLAVLLPLRGEAGSLVAQPCTTRPLSHFLTAQGTLNIPPQFFPPVKDYVGWADAVDPETQLPTTFTLVDYAGLANEYLTAQTGYSLGTKVRGLVVECPRADGTAQIAVALFTTRALGFAQSIAALADNNFDFLNTPTLFGAKAVSGAEDPGTGVVDGADAAVGPVTLVTTFAIAAPGAPLPDFLDVVFNPAPYAPVTLHFSSTTFGRCSDGTPARLDVHQVAATNDQKALVFSRETVEVVDTEGGHCGG
jgi:hypothetical protein